MMVLLVHSKSKASIRASRRRRSLNFSRRVLMNQPCAPEAERRKIVARRPDPRGELLAEQIVLGGEAFEGDVAIAIIFEPHRIEIVVAARDGQLSAPPVLDPFVLDEAAGLEAADLVGAGAERRLQA